MAKAKRDGDYKGVSPSKKLKRCAEGNPNKFKKNCDTYDNPIK